MRYLFFIFLVIINCSHTPNPPPLPITQFEKLKLDGLNELKNSIVKITCSAYYQNYYYYYPANTREFIDQDSLLYNKNFTSNSLAATGLIIYQNSQQQLLLTCYHVFNFKDTLKTYYFDKNKKQTNFLASLSIKKGQNILVFHKNGRTSPGKIIAIDEYNDLALVETKHQEILLSEFAFKGEFGSADKLKLGQEVYLLGFPKGFLMVTRGLVSPSLTKSKFLVDALFNRGFSGGVVCTFSSEAPYYQYMGLASSIACTPEPIIAPPNNPEIIEQYQNIPYDGDVFIKNLKLINYGITFVIKSDVVKNFIKSNKGKLNQLGYKLYHIFK